MKMNKYILELEEEQTIEAPIHAWIASAQLYHHNTIALWILEDENVETSTRTFKLYSTGETIDTLREVYVGTVQTAVVKTTYHIFEVMAPLKPTTLEKED